MADDSRVTLRFKNAQIKKNYQRLVQETGVMSLNALMELALDYALPEMRKRLTELRRRPERS